MKKPKRKNTNLEVLTAMHDAANNQFRAMTYMAVGIAMKKMGLKSLVIEPSDLDHLTAGEQIDVRQLPNGGIEYVFIPAPVTLQ